MKKDKLCIIIILGIITAFLGVSLFAWTIPAHLQMIQYFSAVNLIKRDNTQLPQELLTAENIYEPYTYVQSNIRDDLLNRIVDQYQLNDKTPYLAVLPFSLEKLKEVVDEHVFYPRFAVSVAKGYGLLHSVDPGHPEYLTVGESYYKKALAWIPENPETAYGYTVNLLNQKRTNEAIALAKANLERTPTVDLSHQYYGLALYRSSVQNYDQALEEFETGFSFEQTSGLRGILPIYVDLFKHYYNKKDFERFRTVNKRLIQIHALQRDIFKTLEVYMAEHGKIPVIDIK